MKYLNFILTLICLLLIIIILQLNNNQHEAKASIGVTDVNIREVGGIRLHDKYIYIRLPGKK